LAATAASRVLGRLLFEVAPLDPAAYALAMAVLSAVAGIAIWLPARAATRVPPGIILRS
jgi:putative ABC transport system permease protein